MESDKSSAAVPGTGNPPAVGDPDFNPVAETATAPATCPKCKAVLIDPSGLGWCRACGYCKSLEEDKARVPLNAKAPQRKASALGMVEFVQVLAKLPTWTLVLGGGVAVVFAINVAPARLLAPNPLSLATWSTAEIVLGLLMIFAAQLWSLCVLAPTDEKLHFRDAVLSGPLWVKTLSRLPATRGQTWLAGWGLACILSAIFVTGGLSHWMNYLPKKASPPPVVVDESP